METVKRINIFKAIEKALILKTYDVGYISHRKDGDWQKTSNGRVRLKRGGSGNNKNSSPSNNKTPLKDLEKRVSSMDNKLLNSLPKGKDGEPSVKDIENFIRDNLGVEAEEEYADLISSVYQKWKSANGGSGDGYSAANEEDRKLDQILESRRGKRDYDSPTVREALDSGKYPEFADLPKDTVKRLIDEGAEKAEEADMDISEYTTEQLVRLGEDLYYEAIDYGYAEDYV